MLFLFSTCFRLALPLVLNSVFGKMAKVEGSKWERQVPDDVYLTEAVTFLWCSKEFSIYSLHHHSKHERRAFQICPIGKQMSAATVATIRETGGHQRS